MTRFVLNNDTLNIVLSFAWHNVTAKELASDLHVYGKWHEIVPPRFLNAAVSCRGRAYDQVANPFRRGYPYIPRARLALYPEQVWNENLIVLACSLCRERVRSIHTYKRCAQRWVDDCVWNMDPEYFTILHKKLLHKLTPDLFQPHCDPELVRFLLEPFDA